METYQGVKFKHRRIHREFPYDRRLTCLNYWSYLFSQLGLAPVHASGAYGNSSYRIGDSSFMITKSGMIPDRELAPGNYCRIIDIETDTNRLSYDGESPPSSECLLHHLIYQNKPGVQTILHGHSPLLNTYAETLNIPVTARWYPYGTRELADSTLEILDSNPADTFVFIMKEHGFVTLSDDIDKAGRLTLKYFSEMIKILEEIHPSHII